MKKNKYEKYTARKDLGIKKVCGQYIDFFKELL